MPLYTLYPCKEDGTSETFVCFDLADDATAHVHALHILDQHPTATRVVAWAGERKVFVRERPNPDLRLVLTGDRSAEGSRA